MNFDKALEIARILKEIRESHAMFKDSDGNCVKVFYPSGVVEEAARAASLAPDLPTAADEIERVFTAAEERISSGVHTS